jgi:transposase
MERIACIIDSCVPTHSRTESARFRWLRRFVEGTGREQSTLFPECLEDWIGEDNPVRVIDVFVEELDLAELGFSGVDPEATGRPSYFSTAPALCLRLSQSGPVEPPA